MARPGKKAGSMAAWHAHPIPVLDQLGEINGGRKKKVWLRGGEEQDCSLQEGFF